MDSCKIPLGESKWILALGREFLTLTSKPKLSIFCLLSQNYQHCETQNGPVRSLVGQAILDLDNNNCAPSF